MNLISVHNLGGAAGGTAAPPLSRAPLLSFTSSVCMFPAVTSRSLAGCPPGLRTPCTTTVCVCNIMLPLLRALHQAAGAAARLPYLAARVRARGASSLPPPAPPDPHNRLSHVCAVRACPFAALTGAAHTSWCLTCYSGTLRSRERAGAGPMSGRRCGGVCLTRHPQQRRCLRLVPSEGILHGAAL
mgnify:CR=1 FL=1